MEKTLIMLVGNVDSPFVINEIPYICSVFDIVHIFAYNTKDDSQIKCKLPENVAVYHINVCQGWRRLVKYILLGLRRTADDLKIMTLWPRRVIASLYARGRAETVYKFVLSTIEREKIECREGAVYSYWFTDQAIVAWRLAEKLNSYGGRFKSFSRAHGYDLYWEMNGARYLPFQDVSLRHLDGVFPCSEYGVKYLKNKYPECVSKINVARLGTWDFGLAIPPSTQNIFATCCTFEPLKRMPLFAEAFCELWKRDKTACWYCIGGGKDFEKTKEIVHANGADDAVYFMGVTENPRLMEFYKRTPISYFVNVSISEGVPVSIMEALSFGIPIIATNVGGTGELVSASCGILIEAELDLNFLVNVLRAAIYDPQYSEKRIQARKIWEAKASAEKNYHKWSSKLS